MKTFLSEILPMEMNAFSAKNMALLVSNDAIKALIPGQVSNNSLKYLSCLEESADVKTAMIIFDEKPIASY